MKIMSSSTVPGVVGIRLENDRILTRWKGYPGYTLVWYLLNEPDNPEIPTGFFGDLACLQTDFMVKDHGEAHDLARECWVRYHEQILAGDGKRLYVKELEQMLSDDPCH